MRTIVGFSNIRLRFELDTDASGEQLDTLLRLTERYCVVYRDPGWLTSGGDVRRSDRRLNALRRAVGVRADQADDDLGRPLLRRHPLTRK